MQWDNKMCPTLLTKAAGMVDIDLLTPSLKQVVPQNNYWPLFTVNVAHESVHAEFSICNAMTYAESVDVHTAATARLH